MGFCTQCGSSFESGAQFCTRCGARSVGAVPSEVASSGAGTAVQPALEPVMPLPLAGAHPNSNKPMIIAVIFVLLVAGGAAYYFFSQPKSSAPAPIVDGPQSSSAALETYGLQNYPGARPTPVFGEASGRVIAAFETSDSPEQVMGYYRVRFPVSEVISTETGLVLTADMNGSGIEVRAEPMAQGSRVQITSQ